MELPKIAKRAWSLLRPVAGGVVRRGFGAGLLALSLSTAHGRGSWDIASLPRAVW